MMSSRTTERSSRRVLVFAGLFLLGTSAILADTLWTRTYGSPWDGDDAACTVLTDTFNNTTVVGTGGQPPGTRGSNMVVIKYSNQNGRTMWTKRITAADTSADVAMDAAIRPAGSVCVTGQTGRYPNCNILTVQLDPNGNEVWRATFDGVKHAGDFGTAIATDTTANVFVAGCAQNATMDFVTMKYYWDGTRAWAKIHDGGRDDKPTDVALGPDGSVYVTGDPNYLTVKYSRSGVEQWAVHYGGHATALVVDEAGSVYITGYVIIGSPPNVTTHIATVKYDSAGGRKWAALYEHPGSMGATLALGGSVLYVAGKTASAAGDDDYVTIAYDCETGDTLWVRRHASPSGTNDAAVGVAVGSDSSVWVFGSANFDFTTVLYSPDGIEHWVEHYGNPYDDGAVAIAIDKANQVVVTGNTWANSGYDILTVKFDTIGLAVAEPRDPRPHSDFRFEVVPNPSASGLATLRFNTRSAGAANVTVSGVDGRVALTRSIETDGTGVMACQLDLGKLEAGVYIVRLVSGGRAMTQKLVIGR